MPAYRLDDAPAAGYSTLPAFLHDSKSSEASMDFVIKVQPCGRGLHFIRARYGCAEGTLTTHADGISGCGAVDVLNKLRSCLSRRFGTTEVQERASVRLGMEIAQRADFSITASWN